MTHLTEMVYWINEREAMRRRKALNLPLCKYGWSDDPAMGIPRYCNVHREDDRVTKWIADNWRNPNASHPNLTLGMVLARMINWPATLAEMPFPFTWCPTEIKATIRIRQDRGEKVWTSAYTISTCGRAMAKEDYVIDHVCQQVYEWRDELRSFGPMPTLASYHQQLMQVDGLGSFLAAQVVADLKNTPGHPLATANDWETWSAPGPGSLRGLNWYFHGRPDGPITPSFYQHNIEQCWAEVAPHLEDSNIHMQDFQNCLCEFSKFMKIKSGDTHVRNKYRPGSDPD